MDADSYWADSLSIAEISPPSIRGRLMGFYELMLQVGGVVGFWINYAVSKNIAVSQKQWRTSIFRILCLNHGGPVFNTCPSI